MTLPAVGDLAGITVALLRSPERGAAMAAELTRRGAGTVIAPLIDWELPEDTTDLDRHLAAAAAYDWLLVTSVTTVRALVKRAEALRLDLPAMLRAVDVAAVGTATRTALVRHGFTVSLTPADDQSAEGLMAALPTAAATALLPQSDLAADTLGAGLKRRGWSVDAVTAYRTVDYPADAARRIGHPDDGTVHGRPVTSGEELLHALSTGLIDAVVLTSPSIAARLHAMMGTLPETVATVAIGRRTAHDAAAFGLRIDLTAESPDPTGIADAVSTAVVNHRKRN